MRDRYKHQFLRLVDDPVVRVIQMLRNLPLESAVSYLEMVAGDVARRGLLTDADRERIDTLISQVAVEHIDRAA